VKQTKTSRTSMKTIAANKSSLTVMTADDFRYPITGAGVSTCHAGGGNDCDQAQL
jgi:hypothetical protein